MNPIKPPTQLLPMSYDLGPVPVVNGFVVTEEALALVDDFFSRRILIEPRQSENNKVTKWAITDGSRGCIDKTTGSFVYESIPSERREEFLQKTRFDSPEEALKFWQEVGFQHQLDWSIGYLTVENGGLKRVKHEAV